MTELEKDLQQLIQSADIELEDRLRIAREEATAEHNVKVEQAIEVAKKHWEEEQEEERYNRGYSEQLARFMFKRNENPFYIET